MGNEAALTSSVRKVGNMARRTDHNDKAPMTDAAVQPAVGKAKKAATERGAARANMADGEFPAGYKPGDDEPFMGERQKLYFQRKLMAWREQILREGRETLQALHDDTIQHADISDRATHETDKSIELRARDRQRKLIAKIDAALGRIEDGSYGYCEETGEPIGLKRLDARPVATLSLEAQEGHEQRERVYRDDRVE